MKQVFPVSIYLLLLFTTLRSIAQIPDPAQIERLKRMAQSMQGMSTANTKQNADSILKAVNKIMKTKDSMVNKALNKTAADLPNGNQLLLTHHYENGFVKLQFFYSYKTTTSSSQNHFSTYFSCSGKSDKAPQIFEASGHIIVGASSAGMNANTSTIDAATNAIDGTKPYMNSATAQKNNDISRQISFSSWVMNDNSIHPGAFYNSVGSTDCASSNTILTSLIKESFSFEYDPVTNLSSVGVGAQFKTRTNASSSCYLNKGSFSSTDITGMGLMATTDITLAKMVGKDRMTNTAEDPTYITVSKTATGFKITYRRKRSYVSDGVNNTVDEQLTAFIGEPENEYEAIIKPVEKDGFKYERWLPGGPKTNNSDDTKGDDSLQFYVIVQNKADHTKMYPGNFSTEWTLNDVTNYPGICNNYPAFSQNPNTDLDLLFDTTSLKADDNFESDQTKAQLAISKENKGAAATVKIISMDYAAWAKLKVTVTLDDGSIPIIASPYYSSEIGFITIPYDKDENKLADQWETSQHIFKAGHPLTWDEDSKPDKQRDNGDGYTLFEEYRGFAVHHPDATEPDKKDKHERTDPNKKDAFVYDKDDLFKKYYETDNPSDLSWHYLSRDMQQLVFYDDITLPLHRWVNFNKTADYFYSEQYCLVIELSDVSYKYDTLMTACSFTIGEWQYAQMELAGITPTAEENDAINYSMDPVRAAKSPLKNFIKIEVYPKRIDAKANKVKTELGEAAYVTAFKALINGSIKHEIGHCIGIRHHHASITASTQDFRDEASEGAEDGVESCVMRYLTLAQRADPIVLMTPRKNYCKQGESGPYYFRIWDLDTNNERTETYTEHLAGNKQGDNCYGQISVKSKPGE